MAILAPSILSADFAELGKQIGEVEKAGAQILHIDVMDGHFVPNISLGAGVMKSLVGRTSLPFDVHLMISDPDKYAEQFVTPQTEYITVHLEAGPHIHRSLQIIKNLGVKAGVSINPGTPVAALGEILDMVDLVLLMSVNPGFGGQKFIPSVKGKMQELVRLRAERGFSFKTEIDGGVTLDNAAKLVAAGTDILVAGSSVFGASDIAGRVGDFIQLI